MNVIFPASPDPAGRSVTPATGTPSHGRPVRRSTALLAAILAICVLLGGAGAAQQALALEFADDHAHAELIAAQNGVAPGQRAQLALRLRHAPHWHTYWSNPGDAGLPTTLKWTLPAGASAGDLEWPVPQLLRVGSLANYGYEGEVLLPVSVTVPADATPGSTLRLRAHASWLVCNDTCIPGGSDVGIDLPVRDATTLAPSDEAAAIARARAMVPAARELAQAQALVQDGRVRLRFGVGAAAPASAVFFPLQGGWIRPAAPQTLARDGALATLDLERADPDPTEPGPDTATTLEGVLVVDGGLTAAPRGWAARVRFPVVRKAGWADAHAATGASGTGTSTAAGTRATTSPAAPPNASLATASVPVAGASAGADATGATLASGSPGAQAQDPSGPPPSVLAPVTTAPAAMTAGTLLVSMAGAFLGGLILNLMPCVFPVLSLKILALAREGGPDRAHPLGAGLAYTAGVVLSFLLLGVVLVALRGAGAQVGWGFQLQSPAMITGLLSLFFLIGLNLLGVFEVSFGQGLANSRWAQAISGDGPSGSFVTGVLAAVVASPCTAPFMGAALGIALGQSAAVALAIFTSLGLGMAAPFLLLALFPSLTRRMPRPGPWMEHLRQALAFPMLLTCVWLCWVLARQVDADALAAMLAGLVALGGFTWALGVFQRGTRHYRWVALLGVVLAGVCIVPVLDAAPAVAAAGTPRTGQWQAWSPSAQQAAIASGHEVLVDFTAAWCITCQANERYALNNAQVRGRLEQAQVVLLKADWTLRDEAITRELALHGRSGVPLYVYYDRSGHPHVLPELLTPGVVLEALGPA